MNNIINIYHKNIKSIRNKRYNHRIFHKYIIKWNLFISYIILNNKIYIKYKYIKLFYIIIIDYEINDSSRIYYIFHKISFILIINKLNRFILHDIIINKNIKILFKEI